MKKVIINTILSLTLGASLIATSTPVKAETDDVLLASLKNDPTMQIHSIQVENDRVLDVFASLFLKKLNFAHAEELAATAVVAAAPTPTPEPTPSVKAAATPAPKQNKPVEKKAKVSTASAKNSGKTSSNMISTPNGDKKYKKRLSIRATAYSADLKENGQWGPVDYFGNPLRLGTIAVDPNVIPLGSSVYITGYSSSGLPGKGMIAKAADMGSAIKGNRIDIYIPGSSSIAEKFGFQNVEVYVLS
ncbi:3D domain-containing protein [Paenibacillus sp. KN14-4R]|uniref:3D domain-containing protein n=1 Tax=Paenibacillus sp. KN14-4R TaxID=3445773 RepID=UPI003FA04FD6